MAKRLRQAAVYAVYLVGVVAAICYVALWRPFVGEVAERFPPPAAWEAPRHVSPETLRKLGSIASGRPGTFVHFEVEKAPGVVRACALGDSYTYGDEVAPGGDYPAQLQAIARARGIDALEVINFASNWHGFHQSFVIWEDVASRFGCDFALLGPASFQARRDTEFNHTGLARPYYLHARYVLEPGGDVRLVEVEGETQRERFADYFRFVPHWRYLRYDRNPPPVLRSLVPRDRTLANPFYYFDGTPEQESLAIYARLIRRIADTGVQVVVVQRDPAIVEMVGALGHPNAVAQAAFDHWLFPYRAPQGHNSAWTNRVLAEQFLAHIAESDGGVSLLEFAAAPADAPTEAPQGATLADFTRLEARMGDVAVGALFTASRDFFRAGEPAPLADAGFRSILVLKDPRVAAPDAAFLPLHFTPASGAPVTVEGAGDGGADLEIGRVQWLDRAGVVALAQLEGFEFQARREVFFHGSPSLDPRAQQWDAREVRIGGEAVLKGFGGGPEASGPVVLYPANGAIWKLAAPEAYTSDLAALPAEGSLDLALDVEGGSAEPTLRVPLATWRKLEMRMEIGAKRLPRRLDAAGSHVASVEPPVAEAPLP